jgi:hypothetical protein
VFFNFIVSINWLGFGWFDKFKFGLKHRVNMVWLGWFCKPTETTLRDLLVEELKRGDVVVIPEIGFGSVNGFLLHNLRKQLSPFIIFACPKSNHGVTK